MKCNICNKEYDNSIKKCPYCNNKADNYGIVHLQNGDILRERFIIMDVVGIGGFGIIYRAEDTTMKKTVAIKEFFPTSLVTRFFGAKEVRLYNEKEKAEFQKGVARFLEEADNVSKINHPNIVKIYDFFEENNTAYMVMEYLKGITLKEMLKSSDGFLHPNLARDIVISVAEGLEAIHRNKIIHRDISPDNIFVGDGVNNIKIIDFGAAKFMDDKDTSTYPIVIKPGYAPPEQYIKHSEQGTWTDIYALGATFYTIVTGSKPPESTKRLEKDKIIEPIHLVEGLSPTINNVIMRSMALEKELRYKKDKDFIKALKDDKYVRNVKEEVKYRKSRRVLQIVASIILISILAFSSYKYYQFKKENAMLKKTTIQIWYSYNNKNKKSKKIMMDTLTKDFIKKNPNVHVEVVGISEKKYKKTLKKGISKNKVVLFESNVFNKGILKQSMLIDDMDSVLGNSKCIYLDFSNRKRIPTGFTFPMVVENTSSKAKNIRSIAYEYSEYDNYNTIYDSFKSIDENINVVKENSINSSVIKDGSVDMFINDKFNKLITSSKNYHKIQNKKVGRYKLIKLDKDKHFIGYYTGYWSINDKSSEKQKLAAKKYISYLFSEYAQELMYIKNSNGSPLNNNELDVFFDVNKELSIYKDILDNLDVKDKE